MTNVALYVMLPEKHHGKELPMPKEKFSIELDRGKRISRSLKRFLGILEPEISLQRIGFGTLTALGHWSGKYQDRIFSPY
jgi:hypothetical protein